MNTIEGALWEYLQTAPTIAQYVGGTGAPASPPPTARIYPVHVKQAARDVVLPAISYSIIAGESEIYLSGARVGIAQKRIQISAWSMDVMQAKAIIESVRLLTNGFIGFWDDVYVKVTGFTYAPDIYDHTARVNHASCHLIVWHAEPT
jgi:hypothetical protein